MSTVYDYDSPYWQPDFDDEGEAIAMADDTPLDDDAEDA